MYDIYLDYSALQVGVKFFIMKDSAIVVEGVVKESFQHEPHKKNNCRVLYSLEFI